MFLIEPALKRDYLAVYTPLGELLFTLDKHDLKSLIIALTKETIHQTTEVL